MCINATSVHVIFPTRDSKYYALRSAAYICKHNNTINYFVLVSTELMWQKKKNKEKCYRVMQTKYRMIFFESNNKKTLRNSTSILGGQCQQK